MSGGPGSAGITQPMTPTTAHRMANISNSMSIDASCGYRMRSALSRSRLSAHIRRRAKSENISATTGSAICQESDAPVVNVITAAQQMLPSTKNELRRACLIWNLRSY